MEALRKKPRAQVPKPILIIQQNISPSRKRCEASYERAYHICNQPQWASRQKSKQFIRKVKLNYHQTFLEQCFMAGENGVKYLKHWMKINVSQRFKCSKSDCTVKGTNSYQHVKSSDNIAPIHLLWANY